MKRYSPFILQAIVILALLFSLPLAAQASPSAGPDYPFTFSISGASNGVGLAMGQRFDDWGVEIGAVLTDDKYSDALDYPCPHNDYQVLDDDYIKNTYGLDFLRYFDFSDTVALYLGAGVYFSDHQEIVQSRATGWIYENSDETQVDPAFSGGLVYQNGKTLIGVGYHSIRGTSLQFGTKF